MPLTEQEQIEFAQLLQQRQGAKAGGLSLGEQREFNILQQQRSPFAQISTTDLMSRLGGQLPSETPVQRRVSPLGVGLQEPAAEIEERERQNQLQIVQELQNRGFSLEDIGGAFAFGQATKPPSDFPRIAGATVGSLAALGIGALIPGPEELVTVPGAAKIGAEIVSAGLGGAAGRAIQVTRDPDEEFTFNEFKRAFGESAAEEIFGIGVVGGAKRLLSGARKTITPGVARLSAMLGPAGKRAGVKGRRVITRGFTRARMRFLPATFSQNQIIDTLQGIGEGSLVGSNTIFQFKRGIRKSIVQLQKELVEDFTKGTTKRGTLASATVLFDTIKGNRTAWSKTGAALYRSVDDFAKGTKPAWYHGGARGLKGDIVEGMVTRDFAEAKRFADAARGIVYEIPNNAVIQATAKDVTANGLSLINPERYGFIKGVPRGQKGFGKIASQPQIGVEVSTKGLQRFTKGQWDLILETGEIAGDPKLNTIFRKAGKKLPSSASFEASHLLRSKLLSIERAAKTGATPKHQTAKIARDMINEITGSMESAAKTRPGLFKQYRRAADYWKAGSKRFDNDIVRGLTKRLRNHPQLAALATFHPNTAQELRLVRKAAGEKAFKEMRGAWLEQLLKDSASKEVGEEGVLMGTSFLDKFENMGDETLDVIFTKKEISAIKDVAESAAFAQQKTGGVGGSLKIVQGIAAFSLVASPLLPEGDFRGITRGTAGVILLGPAVISRMMTNPLSARLLSEGFKVRPVTRQGVALTARLIKQVLKTRAEINKEEQARINRLSQQQRFRREIERGRGIEAEQLTGIGLGF